MFCFGFDIWSYQMSSIQHFSPNNNVFQLIFHCRLMIFSNWWLVVIVLCQFSQLFLVFHRFYTEIEENCKIIAIEISKHCSKFRTNGKVCEFSGLNDIEWAVSTKCQRILFLSTSNKIHLDIYPHDKKPAF